MNIAFLSWKNMINRPWSTALSLILLTLGTGLISLILNFGHQIEKQFSDNIKGIDMVVGAKGSPLQLVLSSVFHLDNPTGNISLKETEGITKNRFVASTIPLSYGDNYSGYRILGTTDQYLSLYDAKLRQGNYWVTSMELVLGSEVAKVLSLKIGDQITSVHGLAAVGEMHDENLFMVTGILAPTATVLDQLILTSLESVWDIHRKPSQDTREITALLVKFKSPMGLIKLPRWVNQNTNMQAALPIYEINRLFGIAGAGIDILNAIGLAIILVSGISVFISLYNAMKSRQYEMALLRSYGASKNQLFRLILLEGLFLSLLGYILGIAMSRIGLVVISEFFQGSFNYQITSAFLIEEIWLLLITLMIGILAALIPSIQVYKINITKALAHG